jgi:cytochrome c5
MKSRTLLAVLMGLALCVGLIGMTRGAIAEPLNEPVVVAAEDAKDQADAEKPTIKPSDKKGKYWFKKSCKSCHGSGGEGGEVTPMSKTTKQWERYFKKDAHTKEQKLEGTFDAEQLIHIRFFLINHAADSDQPETCG